MENETLATELLHMLKTSAKRWFIISMVELAIIALLLIFLFVIPVETYTETEYQQEISDINEGNIINQTMGDSYGDSETDGD